MPIIGTLYHRQGVKENKGKWKKSKVKPIPSLNPSPLRVEGLFRWDVQLKSGYQLSAAFALKRRREAREAPPKSNYCGRKIGGKHEARHRVGENAAETREQFAAVAKLDFSPMIGREWVRLPPILT